MPCPIRHVCSVRSEFCLVSTAGLKFHYDAFSASHAAQGLQKQPDHMVFCSFRPSKRTRFARGHQCRPFVPPPPSSPSTCFLVKPDRAGPTSVEANTAPTPLSPANRHECPLDVPQKSITIHTAHTITHICSPPTKQTSNKFETQTNFQNRINNRKPQATALQLVVTPHPYSSLDVLR